MADIVQLDRSKYPRRYHGECQRCGRKDYLPWATEDGTRYCAHCHEKDALECARLAGWNPPGQFLEVIRLSEENKRLREVLQYIIEEGDHVARWVLADKAFKALAVPNGDQ